MQSGDSEQQPVHSPKSDAYDEALAEMSGLMPDIIKAKRLLKNALDEGDLRAAYALGTWYLHGLEPVISRDLKSAETLLTIAADAGIADALFDLAVSYEKGEFSQPQLQRAFHLYLRAALEGEQQSVYEVGRCYYYGIGVVPDRQVAEIWLARARELGIASDGSHTNIGPDGNVTCARDNMPQQKKTTGNSDKKPSDQKE